VSVSLRSPRHPLHPSTCSMGAGGLWMPYKCDDARMDKWALQTLDELMPMAAGTAGSTGDSAVEIVPTVMLKRYHHGPKMQDFLAKDYDGGGGGNSPLPAWTKDSRLAFQHLTVEMLWWQNEIFQLRIPSQAELVEAGYLYAWLFNPPIVDAPRMLQVRSIALLYILLIIVYIYKTHSISHIFMMILNILLNCYVEYVNRGAVTSMYIGCEC
jgi:D-amino-acid oxidase